MGAEVYKLEVTVKNKGDDAYNAKLYVDIPKGISVRQRGVFRVDGDKVSCGKDSHKKTIALESRRNCTVRR